MIKIDKGSIKLSGNPTIIISEAAGLYAHIVEMVCSKYPEVDPEKARDVLRKTVYLHALMMEDPEANVYEIANRIGLNPEKLRIDTAEEEYARNSREQ